MQRDGISNQLLHNAIADIVYYLLLSRWPNSDLIIIPIP